MTSNLSTLLTLQKVARSTSISVTAPTSVLETELMQEKAATLGRLTRTFEHALAAYVSRSEGESAVPEADEQALRDAAADALWQFVVQRETCGLRNTEAVLREYRVPLSIRRRMGVRRNR